HLCESIACLVVPEAIASLKPNRSVVRWCSIAIATLETEIDRSTAREREQIATCIQRWRPEGGEYIECREVIRIEHQRQIDEILDRAICELRPDLVVLAPSLRIGRAGRPADPHGAEEL